MRFRLAPRSVTLDDLELLEVHIFSEFCATSHFWEKQRLNEHCQRGNCCALKVLKDYLHHHLHLGK